MMEAAQATPRQAAFRGGGSLAENLGFSIERVPGFVGVMDLFGAATAVSLEPLLRARVATSVETPTGAGLFETLLQLQGKVGAVLYCVELDARVLLVFEDSGVEMILRTIFSDLGSTEPERAERREPRLTRIESNLVREAAIALGSALEVAFRQAAHAPFVLENFLPIKGVDVLGRRDVQIVTANLSMATAALKGQVKLIVPQSLLQALRYELSERRPDTAAADPRWARQIEVGVTRANLHVSAILEEMEMTLSEIASFRTGQVIELHEAGNARVQLQSEGKSIFWGRVDEANGQYRVIIEEPVADEPILGI